MIPPPSSNEPIGSSQLMVAPSSALIAPPPLGDAPLGSSQPIENPSPLGGPLVPPTSSSGASLQSLGQNHHFFLIVSACVMGLIVQGLKMNYHLIHVYIVERLFVHMVVGILHSLMI